MLGIKQKLAQCLTNCKTHCKELEKLKKEQLMFDEERLEWQNDEAELNKIIEDERNTANAYLERVKMLEN
jgi:hypothetical protein